MREITGIERYFSEMEVLECATRERLRRRAEELKANGLRDEVIVLNARLTSLRVKMRDAQLAFAQQIAPLDMEIRDMEERLLEMKKKVSDVGTRFRPEVHVREYERLILMDRLEAA